jgi:hypothetical protein
VRCSRFIGVGVGIGIGIDSAVAIVSVGAAHIVRRGGMCAMNLPSIFAHMQKAHVCVTQRGSFDSDSGPDPESYNIQAGSG